MMIGFIHGGEINVGAEPFWLSFGVMAKTTMLRHYVFAS